MKLSIIRPVTKFGAHLAVCNAVAITSEAALNAVIDTEDEDTKSLIHTVSGTAAIAATMMSWRRVDNLVDRVADWRAERKIAKAVVATVE